MVDVADARDRGHRVCERAVGGGEGLLDGLTGEGFRFLALVQIAGSAISVGSNSETVLCLKGAWVAEVDG